MNRYIWTLVLAQALLGFAASESEDKRLAGLFVKDGNENGQLRFLAAGLNGGNGNGNGLGGLNGNSGGLNSALNQYITNKQDMLEQLRPVTTGTGSAINSVTGTAAAGGASNGVIYVNLNGQTGTGAGTGTGTFTGTGTGTATGTGTGLTNQQLALNQVIYGTSPVNNLLPQIMGQAISQRRRPAAGGNNRRRVQQRRRRVNKNGRRRKGNKSGKKRPQVTIVRPNRG
ncbi:putative per-hexamer repeat protein 5 [Drosophila busckii]|uniref:putative per-hexamer repeat protein 5 n=1 Tax=Drosophila busckii TaxID=30019 RepID=UPI001432E016|nr:putative per-hexamer repeat protein 5 [Drosophila busckii]